MLFGACDYVRDAARDRGRARRALRSVSGVGQRSVWLRERGRGPGTAPLSARRAAH
eukprot:gene5129-13255_t